MQPQDLPKRMLELHERNTHILAQADAAGRDLTPAETAEIENNFAEFERIDQGLETRETIEAHGRKLGQSAGRKTSDGPPAAGPGQHQGSVHPLDRGGDVPKILPAKSPRYADMFGQAEARSLGPWQSTDEFVNAVAHRVMVQNSGQSESIGPDGGFLVPSALLAGILDGSLENEIVRPRAKAFALTSASATAPGLDTSDHSANIGGFELQWLGEGGTGTVQTAQFWALTLRANKAAIFAKCSSEIAEDGVGFSTQLNDALTQALSFGLDYNYLWGDGVGKPLGILNWSGLVSVAKDTRSPSQSADTLVYRNVIDMFARLHPACVKNAVWLVHPSALPQLFSMSQDRTASTQVPIFVANASATPGGTLLGLPLIVTEKCAALGNQGDIILADFSQYACALRRGARLERDLSTDWLTDEINFRLLTRLDGQPLWKSAVTPRNGSDTLSCFVTLDERA